MKSQVWFCSALCVGVFYMISLVYIIIKYNDIFKTDLDIPNLKHTAKALQHDEIIRKSIRDHQFHMPDEEDIIGLPLQYRNYTVAYPGWNKSSSSTQSPHPHPLPTPFHSSGRALPFDSSPRPSPPPHPPPRRHLIPPQPQTEEEAKSPNVLGLRDLDKESELRAQSPEENLRQRRDMQDNSLVKTAEEKLSDYEVESDKDENKERAVDNYFHIEVVVGKWNLSVLVDGKEILHEQLYLSDIKFMRKGGLYLVVLHQSEGRVMHSSRHRTFEVSGDKDLLTTLDNIQPGRIVVLAAVCEAFAQVSNELEAFLRAQGSKIIADMSLGDRWAWIWTKNGETWAEGSIFSAHPDSYYWQGGPMHLHAHPPRVEKPEIVCQNWPIGDIWDARREFCDLYEGYGDLCNCETPMIMPLTASTAVVRPGRPTIVVASERPLALHRCLSRLISVSGSNPNTTLVVADGNPSVGLKEVEKLVRLFGMQYAGHDSGSNNVTIRITRHYKTVFEEGFRTFLWADNLIILEEDLYVAEDFYSYFDQVTPLLDQDRTLYCVSAWNDLSTVTTASDPTVVLRSETMAGLGWVLTKRLYQEIMPKWPAYDKFADWDMWMRLSDQRKGRECLVPEVPRTFHFGTVGAHITSYSQSKYYAHVAFNSRAHVKLQGLDRLGPKSYDSLLREMIVNGKHMDGSAINPCKKDLISPSESSTHVMWIKMNEYADNYTISAVFNCLGLWDLDIRGGHKYVWRIRLLGIPLLIIGWPLSPFSSLRPQHVNVMRRADPSISTPDPPVFKILNANETQDYTL